MNHQRAKVVITGASSFIGHHLCCFFDAQQYKVAGTLRRPPDAYEGIARKRIERTIAAGISMIRLDLTDDESLRAVVRDQRPTFWIHHAGWATDYGGSDYDLDMGYRTNVRPLNLLYPELAQVACRGVVITGSSAEYTDREAACQEDDSCFPDTPYGLSKLNETLLARQLARRFDLATRVIRVFIPYGAYDAPAKLIPSVISALMARQPVNLSACEQKRDFIFVNDLMRGYEAVVNDLTRSSIFDIFNICSGQPVQLKKLLIHIAEQLRAGQDLLNFGAIPMRLGEPLISYGSNSKAQKQLDWAPSELLNGLQRYLEACHRAES